MKITLSNLGEESVGEYNKVKRNKPRVGTKRVNNLTLVIVIKVKQRHKQALS